MIFCIFSIHLPGNAKRWSLVFSKLPAIFSLVAGTGLELAASGLYQRFQRFRANSSPYFSPLFHVCSVFSDLVWVELLYSTRPSELHQKLQSFFKIPSTIHGSYFSAFILLKTFMSSTPAFPPEMAYALLAYLRASSHIFKSLYAAATDVSIAVFNILLP